MSKEKVEVPVEEEIKKAEPPKKEKKVDVNGFINRKLKDINEMDKPATAKALADRVRKNGKEN